MIFQSGHGWCKNSKRSLPVSEHWINNRKEKPKNICDNNKDLIEYHKNDVEMQEQLPLEEKLNNLVKLFAKFHGFMGDHTPTPR